MTAVLVDKLSEPFPYRVYADIDSISLEYLWEMFGKGFDDKRYMATIEEWETVNWIYRSVSMPLRWQYHAGVHRWEAANSPCGHGYRIGNHGECLIGFRKKSDAVKLFLSKEWD